MEEWRHNAGAETGLYEKVLAELGGAAAAAAQGLGQTRVRASASVVLWRSRERRLEVFWVRRSPDLAFMGGWHAFPGGGRARADEALAVEGRPVGGDRGPREAGMPGQVLAGVDLEPVLAPGVVAAALRELFEETGVLPGGEAIAIAIAIAGPRRGDLRKARQALLAGETDFAASMRGLGLRPDATQLTYAGRWLTPPLGPVRFDNRFFLLEWPEDYTLQPEVIPGELASGEWVTPDEAIACWQGGEVITAPPILHILQVLGEDGPQKGLGRLLDPSEANIGPFRRIEFRPGVLLFPVETPTLPPATHTNVYVLGHGETVLVDPGTPFPERIDDLLGALRRLESEGRKITAIWLTHHHRDHVGAVNSVREELGVPVCAHPATAERVKSVGIRVDRALQDDDRVVLAGDPPMHVRILHTPGHARGHLVFLDETGGSLLAGDLVAGYGTLVIDPPEGDMTQYLDSLDSVRALDVDTLFPAHGPTIHRPAAFLDRLVEHRLGRERRILDAWRAGLRETETLLDTVYDDILPMARPLAARQLQAHLDRLRELGSI